MRLRQIPVDDSLTGRIWGGLFFNPRFTIPASTILDLSGNPVFLCRDDVPVIALNLMRKERFLARSATVPLLFQYYGGAFVETDPSPLSIDEFESYLRENVDFAIFSFPPDFPAHLLAGRGWDLHESVTLVLRERELARWGQDFRDDVRNKIRKAKRESIQIEEADSLPENLWSAAYTRKELKTPIAPWALKSWCDRLKFNSLLRIFVAMKDDKPVAFRGQLILDEFAYDWIAGSDPEFHTMGTNQLLMAEIGDIIAAGGVKTWDLVGGEIKSIYDFKKSFGALVQAYRIGKKCFNSRGRLFSFLRDIRYGE